MDPKVENYRIERGLILKALAEVYPGTVDFKVIQSLLVHMGHPLTKETLLGHLSYMADETKAYIINESRKGFGFNISFSKITPKGLDLLDHVTPAEDPGIFVEFE